MAITNWRNEQSIQNIVDDNPFGVNLDVNARPQQAGEEYQIDVTITMAETPGNKKTRALDPNNIVELAWENKINRLFLTGHLIFKDNTGHFGLLNSSIFSHVGVRMVKIEPEGGDGQFKPGKEDKREKFTHSFIVDNVQIINRELNVVTYKLFLVSDLWIGASRNLHWSNYDKIKAGGSLDPKYFNPYKILMELFNLAFYGIGQMSNTCLSEKGPIDKDSFEKAASETPKLLYEYSTGMNTKLDESISYLMNRSVMEKSNMETALRFFVYDSFDKNFKLVNFKDPTTYLKTNRQIMPISLMGSIGETLFIPNQQNFSSLNNITDRELMETFLPCIMYGDDRKNDDFSGGPTKNDEATITTADIARFVSPGDNLGKNIYRLNDKAEERRVFDQIFNEQVAKRSDIDYARVITAWSNTFACYSEQINNTLNRDATIFYTNGRIRHNPGTLVCISLDMPDKNLGEPMDSTANNPHADITNVYFVVKTVHMVRPTDPTEEKFTENLFMQKWWTRKG